MSVVIHRDGRLRVQHNSEDDLFLDPADPLAICDVFSMPVQFEAGLTTAQMMRALRPWSLVLSRAASMDFDAWMAAVDRPALQAVEAKPSEDGDLPVDAVILKPRITCWVEKDGAFQISHVWDVSGRYAGGRRDEHGGQHCSLSMAPPGEWAHLPLLLETRGDVLVHGARRKMTPALDALRQSPVGIVPVFFACVVGMLDDISFHGSPEDTQGQRASLMSMVDEIKADLADGKTVGQVMNIPDSDI